MCWFCWGRDWSPAPVRLFLAAVQRQRDRDHPGDLVFRGTTADAAHAWQRLLSVIIVGMGVSLGREGAPKQAGAVLANVLADRRGLSDEQRRLLVACGAGAGMAAAYGVPLGGALFALEVMRGMLALRLVLPAVLASLIATAVSVDRSCPTRRPM